MAKQPDEGLLSFVRDNPHCTRKQWHEHLRAIARTDRERKRISDRISYYRAHGVIPESWGKLHEYETQTVTVNLNQPIERVLTDIFTGGSSEPTCIEDLFKDRTSIPAKDAAWELNTDRYGLDQMLIDARARGVEIAMIDGILYYGVVEESYVSTLGTDKIVFGVMSDLHYGSKACQITAINRFVEECKKEGVSHIIIPGDITDGAGVYKGQELEQYAITADGQESSVVRNLPVVKGIQYWALGGNHDESFMKAGRGHNPLRAIEREREDFKFIGFTRKKIPILPGVDAVVWHGGNIAYAKSYPLQKHVINIAFDELKKAQEGIEPTVRFLFGGHLHIYAEIMDGGIMSMFCGAFAGANGLTAKMGVDPNIRGLIVWAELDKRGRLCKVRTDKLDYPEIQDDWKNYSHEPVETVIERPLFTR